jgi:hypothetical protein
MAGSTRTIRHFSQSGEGQAFSGESTPLNSLFESLQKLRFVRWILVEASKAKRHPKFLSLAKFANSDVQPVFKPA